MLKLTYLLFKLNIILASNTNVYKSERIRTRVLTGFSSSLFGPKIIKRASASSDESPPRDVLSCSKTSSNGIRS